MGLLGLWHAFEKRSQAGSLASLAVMTFPEMWGYFGGDVQLYINLDEMSISIVHIYWSPKLDEILA